LEFKSSLKLNRSNTTFETWLNQPFVANDLRSQLTRANVLLIPDLEYCGYAGPLFPAGTEDFFHFLANQSSDEIRADICIEDREYRSLALLHDDVWFATVIVLPALAQVIAHYVIRFLDEKLGSRVTETRIKSKVVIASPETDKSVTVEFEGLASEYDEYVASTLKLVRSEQDLQRLGETENMDHAERIKHLSSNRGYRHDSN